MASQEMALRYGCNPHQSPSRIFMKQGELPIKVLNGSPGYINLLDALNGWQLVSELRIATGLPSAASFKHVSPAGVGVGVELSDVLKKAYFVDDCELTPLATAYARARGADRMSSFGDFAIVSDIVDVPTAQLLKREVSDGVLAPGYEPEALAILSKKKDGKYAVVQIDPVYTPALLETRDVFGITFEQRHNDLLINNAMLETVVTQKKDLSDSVRRDLLVALITLKYTQSNSVCFVKDGQVIGVGAGQQSRVHCTRLAASKVDKWFLRQHPTTLSLAFKEGIKRPDRDNAIDQFLEDDLTPAEEVFWKTAFTTVPKRFTREEKRAWLDTLTGVSLGSDAFFPFRDSIDRAVRSGVSYVVQPGNSLRDDVVIEACNEYAMTMFFCKVRLFHH